MYRPGACVNSLHELLFSVSFRSILLSHTGAINTMLGKIRQWMGGAAGGSSESKVLDTWAKEAGHTIKTVSGQTGGAVVSTKWGWRVEWGPSQRPYIRGRELRFRHELGVPGDVQLLLITRTLAHILESDVFESFTDANQTRIDSSLPDEMRWLAMHPRVSLPGATLLGRRFLLISNAESFANQWLQAGMAESLEEAAGAWWTDPMPMVLTLNRGILTIRMDGNDLTMSQLRTVSELFVLAGRKFSALNV